MYVADVTRATALADAVIETFHRYDIPSTPENYALWYEYHAGSSPSLQRTIDILISNNEALDEPTLSDLYLTFFSSAKEAQVIRETSQQIHETLKELIELTGQASAGARHFGETLSAASASELGKRINDLDGLFQHLDSETQAMARQSAYFGLRLRESSEKIETLERNLESVRREATVDGLTGVDNRKSFDAALRKLAGEAMNAGDALALLLIDIDHFKTVNDTWGHLVGDSALRHVAQVIKYAVRGEDHVARYGGEEFAVILPRTDTPAGVRVAENIRDSLRREPASVGGMTLSIGVSCYDPGEPLAEWIKRADAALYCAKSEGRDQVRVCL